MKLNRLIIISLACIVLLTGCGDNNETKNDETKEPINEGKGIDDVKGEEFNITNLSVVYDQEEDVSTLSGTVTNISTSDISLTTVGLTVLNGEDIMIETVAYIGETITANESVDFTTTITKNLEDATDIKYVINK